MTGRRRVVLGKVGGLYGVRGWVKLWSFTDPVENLLDYAELEIGRGGSWNSARLVEGRRQGQALVGRFEGCSDRDQAAALVGAELAVSRDRLPAAGRGEFYWADLVGLRVVTTEGVELGTVDHMMATGANDVMVVSGERERLLPFVTGQFVREVDLEGGRIVVDWDPDF
jgi:16S rRNA processing protein RimM